MSKDPMSKIRAGDVYKELVRVLSQYHIERQDWTVVDKRPHPTLTVTYCGVTDSMAFPGSPSGRGSAAKYAGVLRRLLKNMQMKSLSSPRTTAGAARDMAVYAAPATLPVDSLQINGADIQRIEYQGQRLVSFAQIDAVHQRVEGTAKRNFSENTSRFEIGTDFVPVSVADIRRLFPKAVGSRGGGEIYLFTRRGYLKIVKSLNDDVAWRVFDEMIDRYFAVEAIASNTGIHLDEATRRILGGIFKSILNSQMDERFAELERRMERLSPGQPDVSLARDYVPSIAAVKMANRGSYRGLSSWVTRELIRYCIGNGYEPKLAPTYPGEKYLFPRSAVVRWLEEGGRSNIARKISVRQGQPEFRFEVVK